MAYPLPFRTKKSDVWSPWKALIGGRVIELGPGDTMTKEEAEAALLRVIPPIAPPSKNGTSTAVGNTPPALFSDSTGDSSKPSKPMPGEMRKNGLSELSPAKLQKFRDQVAAAIATGNVSLDRALLSLFRDKVPILAPEQYMLLSAGWELACEQYFVSGIPPAWIVILLGNVLTLTALYEKSEEKKEARHDTTTNGNSIDGTSADR